MADRCVWFGSQSILNTFELVANILKLGNVTQRVRFPAPLENSRDVTSLAHTDAWKDHEGITLDPLWKNQPLSLTCLVCVDIWCVTPILSKTPYHLEFYYSTSDLLHYTKNTESLVVSLPTAEC